MKPDLSRSLSALPTTNIPTQGKMGPKYWLSAISIPTFEDTNFDLLILFYIVDISNLRSVLQFLLSLDLKLNTNIHFNTHHPTPPILFLICWSNVWSIDTTFVCLPEFQSLICWSRTFNVTFILLIYWHERAALWDNF